MRNFCEPWKKRLNLTLKKTIMTALGRPGESPPNFFFKKALWAKQIRYLLMEWANYVAEKKWRNSVSHGNSSGRFLHGPPLNLVLIQRPDGTRILPIADIKFFILVPRYWRVTKVHGPCDRGPWLWFWTVNWSMRVCNWVSHWKAALIQFPGPLPIFLSQPVIFRLFRSKTVKLQLILLFYTRFHLIDSLFPVHSVSYLTRLHWLVSLFQAP